MSQSPQTKLEDKNIQRWLDRYDVDTSKYWRGLDPAVGVFQAKDIVGEGRDVTINIIKTPNLDTIRRASFISDMERAKALNHQNIAVVERFDCTPGRCYIVYAGATRNIKYMSKRTTPFSQPQQLAMMKGLAAGLARAHGQKVVHGSITPISVLIDDDDNPMLADFRLYTIMRRVVRKVQEVPPRWTRHLAPETLDRGEVNERADIYGLGGVFYWLVAREPLATDVDTSRQAHDLESRCGPSLAGIVATMLADKSEDRYQSVADVMVALDGITDYGTFPTVALVIPESIRKPFVDKNKVTALSFPYIRAWLERYVGDGAPRHVSIAPAGETDFYLLADTLRIRCRRDTTSPGFVIVAVEEPPTEILLNTQRAATLVQSCWACYPNSHDISYDVTARVRLSRGRDTLAGFISEYSQMEKARADARARARAQTGESIGMSQSFLALYERFIRSMSGLRYRAVSQVGGNLVFEISAQSKIDREWRKDVTVAIKSNPTSEEIDVGSLISINHERVIVATNPDLPVDTIFGPDIAVFSKGHILPSTRGTRVSNKRQMDALGRLAAGNTANPRLRDVLGDITLAKFSEPLTDVSFKQPIDTDKQSAVSQALRTEDVFMLQGPPGTGKTTAIAETAFHIVTRNPGARLLVSSQSHVALDKALKGVAERLAAETGEVVRVGEETDVTDDGINWIPSRRIDAWRERMRLECLSSTARIEKDKQQLWPYSGDGNSEQRRKDVDDALNEAGMLVARIHDDEVLDEADRDDVALYLALARDSLAPADLGVSLTHSVAEYERLRTIIADLQVQRDRLTAIKDLVTQWGDTFGSDARDRQLLTVRVYQKARVIAATCVAVGGEAIGNMQFDWAIVDEAARATEMETLVPLVRANRSILVGDEKQLPPRVTEDIPKSELMAENVRLEEIKKSLFARLVESAEQSQRDAVRMLRLQYRMHPAIRGLVSSTFYGNKLADGEGITAQTRDHGLSAWLPYAVVWYSTTDVPSMSEEEIPNEGYVNPGEVAVIDALLRKMDEAYSKKGITKRVGVVSGYKKQVELLDERLVKRDADSQYVDRWQSLDLTVATVDSYQGNERDIIVFSATRSNANQDIGFLKDHQRLNVALSRARELLCIVGDVHTFVNARKINPADNPYVKIRDYMQANSNTCLIDKALL